MLHYICTLYSILKGDVIMSTKYVPQLGDLILYKGKRMVVVSIKNRETLEHVNYDRTYYLLEESRLEYNHPVDAQELFCNCIEVDIRPTMTKFPNFKKIASQQYRIMEIPYIEVRKSYKTNFDV